MAFGTLYTLTATATALPADGATDATDGHGYARADRAATAAYGFDGVMPPPPPPTKYSHAKNGFVTIALQPKPLSPPETSPQRAGTPPKRRETCSICRIASSELPQTAFFSQDRLTRRLSGRSTKPSRNIPSNRPSINTGSAYRLRSMTTAGT